MSAIFLLNTLIVVISLPTQVKLASPRNAEQPQPNLTRKTESFDPCKIETKLSTTSNKHITKIALSLMSTCVPKVFGLLGESWGSPEKVISIAPKIQHVICLWVRIVFADFSTSNGRLPRRFVQNGSRLYDVGHKMVVRTLSDHSGSADFCPRKTKAANHIKQYCYTKAQILRGFNIFLPCIQSGMKDRVFEHADIVIHAVALSIKRIISNGLLNYLCG